MHRIITSLLLLSGTIANAQAPAQPAPADTANATIQQKPQTELKEVKITAAKKFIEQGAGKTIVNVGASPSGVGTNVLDVLRKSPGILVDGNGNISMQGKQGVMILVDDKQVYLSGTELSEYLKSFASDNIATLELITQPSAKYDAAGNAGIINIRLKRNRKEGFSGNLSSDAGQGLYTNTHNSLTINNQHNKLALTAQASYLYNTGYIRIKTISDIKDDAGNILTTNTRDFAIKESLHDDYGRLGGDYTISDKTKAGLEISGIYHPNTEEDVLKMRILNRATGAVTYSNAATQKGFIRRHLMGNAYLKRNMGADKDLMIVADYLQQKRNARMDLVNTSYDEAGNAIPADLPLHMDRPFFIQAGSLKADYTQKLPHGVALEAGLKSSAVHMDNDAQFSVYDGVWRSDPSRSNHFVYNEHINAAYVSASKDLNARWKAQCGLRAEGSVISGHLLTTGESFTRSALYLFPTAYLSYKPVENHSFEANYGRRVERPNYSLLNPFREYYGQYNYKTGNPGLYPQLTHNIELKHSYKSELTTTLSYGYTKDMIQTIPMRGNAIGVVNEQPQNVATNQVASMSVAAYKKLLAWCEASLNVTGYYQDYSGPQSHSYGYGMSVSIDTTATFKGGWKAEMQFSCSPQYVAYGTKGIYRPFYAGGVSKKIMKDSATLTLNISDPLRIARATERIDLPQVSTKANYEYNSQFFVLGFNYRFGKQKERSEHQSGLTEEKGRM